MALRADDKEFGRLGEELARKFLKKRGYRIIESNYRTPSGELDIIAMDGPTLVFVEVKSRRSTSFGTPTDAVGPHKQKQMTKAALAYIARNGKDGLPCRFDVVGVTADASGDPAVELVRDAFELAGGY